jgi:hypothetical protein
LWVANTRALGVFLRDNPHVRRTVEQVMHTIEMGYDLTTSQATILFVNGLNTELRKEMGRLLLIPSNTIKRWTKIPAEESP